MLLESSWAHLFVRFCLDVFHLGFVVKRMEFMVCEPFSSCVSRRQEAVGYGRLGDQSMANQNAPVHDCVSAGPKCCGSGRGAGVPHVDQRRGGL